MKVTPQEIIEGLRGIEELRAHGVITLEESREMRRHAVREVRVALGLPEEKPSE